MTHIEGEILARESSRAIVATSPRAAADNDWPACGSMSKTQPASALFFQIAARYALHPKGRGSSTTSTLLLPAMAKRI
jgi:hypothetical protein